MQITFGIELSDVEVHQIWALAESAAGTSRDSPAREAIEMEVKRMIRMIADGAFEEGRKLQQRIHEL